MKAYARSENQGREFVQENPILSRFRYETVGLGFLLAEDGGNGFDLGYLHCLALGGGWKSRAFALVVANRREDSDRRGNSGNIGESEDDATAIVVIVFKDFERDVRNIRFEGP